MTETVQVIDVSPTYEFVGRVEAINAVDIQSRVNGFIQSQGFDDGQAVQKDQDLFLVEPASYEIALKEAQAALLSAQTTLRDAERRFERNQTLSRQTISAAVLEESEAARDNARAAVLSAEARTAQAQLNLSYTRIQSPIAGRIGKSAFSIGSLVGASSGALARVVQMDPIRVVFSVSDRAILDLRATAGNVAQDELIARFVPKLRLSNGEAYANSGRIEFFGNEVDPQTASLAIRSTFANAQSLLVPGQFVTVIIQQASPRPRPVVSLGAVQQDREGRYVLAVGADNRVAIRRITTSTQRGQQLVVEDGLAGGERIIMDAVQKALPGSVVRPQERAAANAEPAGAGR